MKNFYVELNAVLDAREGVIKRLAPEKHASIISGNYHKRKGDFFDGVDPVAYRKLYEANEVETLIASKMSNICTFLFSQITEMTQELMASAADPMSRPVVDVNVYPYEFTAEEKAMLRSIVYKELSGIIGVNIIDVPTEKLLPGMCAKQYVMMVIYDYERYINTHSNELVKNPQPKLFLIAPMVYFNTDPEKDEETIDALNKGVNSLALLEAVIAERICLRFINVEYFSIAYPDDRLLKADSMDIDLGMTLDEFETRLSKFDVHQD